MRFSAYAGTAIVPLLARLILFAAFVPAGYHKLTTVKTYEADDARRLQELGVSSEPTAMISPSWEIRTVSWQEEPTPPPVDPEAAETLLDKVNEALQDAGEAGAETVDAAQDEGGDEPEGAAEDASIDPDAGAEPAVIPAASIQARALHDVTLILDRNQTFKRSWKPGYMAWAAAIAELAGGFLILVGLFSRLWGLALAATMGIAVMTTSWPAPLDPGLFKLAQDGGAVFNQLFTQLGLGVLALGVFLTGAGPLSLDRLLFKRKKAAETYDD